MRNGVEGYIYDEKTKTPITSVTLGFIDGYKSNFVGTEKIKNHQSGFFKIEPLKKEFRYTPKYNDYNYPLYLIVEKAGYQSDTVFIGDTIYRKNILENTVLLDTIYLKSIKQE